MSIESDEKNMTVDEAVDPVEKDSEAGTRDNYMDPKVEARLVRKFDVYLMSILGILYLLSFLDRGNIGNANIATPSMSTSLGLVDNQFGAAVSVVYATYVIFEPVWANLLKIISPKLLLSLSTLCWGALTIGTAWAGNYTNLMVIRVLLGIVEAGLFPCLTMYLLMTYRRDEIGRRMSYVFTCSAMSGAFGGLIAYGLVNIQSGSLSGWQYLYLVEGVISLAFAPIAYFWIPNRVDQAWFLNAEEKRLASIRYEINKDHYNPSESFRWSEVRRGLTDWKTYISGGIQFVADITLYGLTTFMPTIIKGMGFSSVDSQLLTVPVYVTGAASFLGLAIISDKYQIRSPFIFACFCLFLIGYIVLAASDSIGGRYAALFIIALGLYGATGTNVAWISGNSAGHFKRATSMGMNQCIGNSAGAAIGSIYNATTAPRYFNGLYISIGLTAFGLVLVVVNAFCLNRINKKRERLISEGAIDQPELGDENPHFRLYL